MIPAQQSADQIIRSAQTAHQVFRGPGVAHSAAVNFHRGRVDAADSGAHLLQNLQLDNNVADLGHIFNAAQTVHHNGSGYNGHDSVFRAAHRHFAAKRLISSNHKFIQVPHSPRQYSMMIFGTMRPLTAAERTTWFYFAKGCFYYTRPHKIFNFAGTPRRLDGFPGSEFPEIGSPHWRRSACGGFWPTKSSILRGAFGWIGFPGSEFPKIGPPHWRRSACG